MFCISNLTAIFTTVPHTTVTQKKKIKEIQQKTVVYILVLAIKLLHHNLLFLFTTYGHLFLLLRLCHTIPLYLKVLRPETSVNVQWHNVRHLIFFEAIYSSTIRNQMPYINYKKHSEQYLYIYPSIFRTSSNCRHQNNASTTVIVIIVHLRISIYICIFTCIHMYICMYLRSGAVTET